ncbi:hypothetical protein VTK73DRAFT_4779 [Phialemonium thermophilum]|uniref:Uncharacterized protein n=1 Tax=Phialemonium thermophilum TaxID=223376 RepID=A0ABR3XYL0_9PEZI
MDAIVQFILKLSSLDVTLIKISEATKDSFFMSIESRVTKTGPVPATMSSMTVEMVFRGGCFGKLVLPEVKTSPSGASVNIYDQPIRILDMTAFCAFVDALMNDEELILTLENGACTIRSLFMTGRCTYRKDVRLCGMNGPRVHLLDVSPNSTTLVFDNPSALEIDHGIVIFNICASDDNDRPLARLQGPLVIVRGECRLNLSITRNPGKPVTNKTKLVGVGGESDAWTSETIKFIHTALELTDHFLAFY